MYIIELDSAFLDILCTVVRFLYVDSLSSDLCPLVGQPVDKVESPEHSANSVRAEQWAARRFRMKGGAAGTMDDLLTSTLHSLFCSILYMIKDNFG